MQTIQLRDGVSMSVLSRKSRAVRPRPVVAPVVTKRNAGGWPQGEFTYTTNDGLVHIVDHWYDDDFVESRLVCGDGIHDNPDTVAGVPSCLMCITGNSRYDEKDAW